MLAGLGTLADGVPMTPTNRSITKNAIKLINTSADLNRVTGLAALVPADGQRLTQRRLQFETIPALNALGRLGSAEPGVTFLTSSDQREAKEIAGRCLEFNAERKTKQQEMTEQAGVLAQALLGGQPEAAVLVLADKRWHHGIAGPAASQIVEKFRRSAILLAPNGPEQWKGSGRSWAKDDLGGWVRAVKALGLIDRGGGHPAAVGLAATSAQILALQTAGLTLSMPQVDNHESGSEVLGEIDRLRPHEWVSIVEALEPFARGNPFPRIEAGNALCQSEAMPMTLKDTGKAWGAKAEFQTRTGYIVAPVWRDCETAVKQWAPGKSYELELEVTAKSHRGRVFFNWAVVASRHAFSAPNALAAVATPIRGKTMSTR
ncbi:MAG: DHHA1 domain-containing protein [Limisphaerales bacterium]